jgi:hypothetical protein
MDFIQCMSNGLRPWWESWTSPILWGAIGAILALLMIIVAVEVVLTAPAPGLGEALLAALVAVVMAVAVAVFVIAAMMFIVQFFAALATCLSAAIAVGLGGAATAVGQLIASGQVTTCAEAQNLLAQAQQAFAAAQAAYDAALAAFDQANQRLQNARTGLTAALGVLVAAIWNPFLLLAAIAAVVAAGVLLARRIQRAAQASARLWTWRRLRRLWPNSAALRSSQRMVFSLALCLCGRCSADGGLVNLMTHIS